MIGTKSNWSSATFLFSNNIKVLCWIFITHSHQQLLVVLYACASNNRVSYANKSYLFSFILLKSLLGSSTVGKAQEHSGNTEIFLSLIGRQVRSAERKTHPLPLSTSCRWRNARSLRHPSTVVNRTNSLFRIYFFLLLLRKIRCHWHVLFVLDWNPEVCTINQLQVPNK